MRIGFVSCAFPLDTERSVHGIFKRMGMFIDALKAMGTLDMLFYVNSGLALSASFIEEMEDRLSNHWGTELHLSLCNMAPVQSGAGRWRTYVSPALSIGYNPPYSRTSHEEQIGAFRRFLSGGQDILFVHRLTAMTPVLLSKEPLPRTYFDLDDIEHIAFERSIRQPPLWPGKRLYYLRLPILKKWEKRAICSSRATFVCSKHDKEYLSGVYGCDNVEVIPNAVELQEETEVAHDRRVLFIGSFAYEPNIVAADYLVTEIWPRVLSAVPDALLLIAGAKPERIPGYSRNPPGVKFLGFVDDLKKLYEEVMVVACPVFSGGGTRVKILEAAAFGRPVVSTTIGAEGLGLREGSEILLRDDPRAFADECIRLLLDRETVIKIGRAGRSAVNKQYDRNEVVRRIRQCVGDRRAAST